MISLPFIYFSIIFFVWGRGKLLNIGNYIILVYAISALLSIIIFYIGYNAAHSGYNARIEISLTACLTYCLLITLTILPFYKFRDAKIKVISKPDPKLFNILSYFLFFIFLVALFQFKDEISKLRLSNLSQIRGDLYENDKGVRSLGGINYYRKIFANIFSSFWPISLLFFFYSVSFLKKSKVFNFFLIASSFSAVLSGIAIAGRTQIIYWILNFGFLYILFNQFLNKKQKRKLRFIGFFLFLVLLMYFLAVTFSRWGKESNSSLANYGGQSFINFNVFFENYVNKKIELSRILPFSSKFFTNNDFNLISYRYDVFSTTGFNIGIFYSFLGDLLVDLGRIGMFIFVIIYYLIVSFSLKRKNCSFLSFSQLFLLIAFINIPLEGLFYYANWKIGNEIFIWGSILFYFLFKYKYSWRTIAK